MSGTEQTPRGGWRNTMAHDNVPQGSLVWRVGTGPLSTKTYFAVVGGKIVGTVQRQDSFKTWTVKVDGYLWKASAESAECDAIEIDSLRAAKMVVREAINDLDKHYPPRLSA